MRFYSNVSVNRCNTTSIDDFGKNMFYLLIFLMIPILEVIVFIQAGQYIGVLNTLVLTILTAIMGMSLLRLQGFQTLQKAQVKLARNEAPLSELFDGLCLFAAGLLLLTPGFVTDTVGFLLFLPPVRAVLRHNIKQLPGAFFQQSGFSSEEIFQAERDAQQNDACRKPSGTPNVIEGEYKDITEKDQ